VIASNVVVLFLAQVATATAVIAIKASTVHPALLAAYRLFLACAILGVPFYLEARRRGFTRTWSEVRHSVLPGAFLAVHFISWNLAARNTLASNASIIVNTLPAVTPILVYFMTRELVTRRELAGTAVALSGVVLLAVGSARFSPDTLLGDGLALGSMLFLAVYLVLARRNNRGQPIVVYLFPMYLSAGVLCLAATLVLRPDFDAPTTVNVLATLWLAAVPTVIGHSLVNLSMRRLPSQLVTLSQLTQFVYATILAYLLFGEVPRPVFFPAAAMIALGVVIVIGARRRKAENKGKPSPD
jgi:drug/metabolite transporter (DMT)-like permease